jgi:hypothetical protein
MTARRRAVLRVVTDRREAAGAQPVDHAFDGRGIEIDKTAEVVP